MDRLTQYGNYGERHLIVVIAIEHPRAGSSEGFRQSGLTQNSIRSVPAWNAIWHGEIAIGDWAVPDLVAAFDLTDHRAAGGAREISQRAVELRRHFRRLPARLPEVR